MTVGPNGTASFHKDPPTAIKTIERVRRLEKDDNILVVLAHDGKLERRMLVYREAVNGWSTARWKQELDEQLP